MPVQNSEHFANDPTITGDPYTLKSLVDLPGIRVGTGGKRSDNQQ
jgi:hypothetical protein